LIIGIVLLYSGVSKRDLGHIRIWLVNAVFLFLKINIEKIFQLLLFVLQKILSNPSLTYN
jgi:hypothetical protein